MDSSHEVVGLAAHLLLAEDTEAIHDLLGHGLPAVLATGVDYTKQPAKMFRTK